MRTTLILLSIVLLPSAAAAQRGDSETDALDPEAYGNLWVTQDTPIYDTPSWRPALFPFIKRTPAEEAFVLPRGEAVTLLECRTEDSMQWFRVDSREGTGWIEGDEYIRSRPQAAMKALESYAELLRDLHPDDTELIAGAVAVLNSLRNLEVMLEAKGIQP